MTDNQIFRLFGIFYLCVSTGILLTPGYYKKLIESFFNERFATFLSGMVALLAGYILIVHHNIWGFSKTAVITIIAWLIFLKGILILALPETFIVITARVIEQKESMNSYGIITLIIGLIFLALSLF